MRERRIGGLIISTVLISTAAAMADPQVVDVPIRYEDHILVRAEVQGHPAELIYDPVEGMILHASFTAASGLETVGGTDAGYGGPVFVGGAGGQEYEARFLPGTGLRLPGIERRFALTTVLPEQVPLARIAGVQVDGLIGTDVFAGYVVEIDLEQERFRLHPPEGFAAPDGVIRLPVRPMGEAAKPTVPVRLQLGSEAVAARMLLDLGMSGTVRLTTRFVDETGSVELLGPGLETGGEIGLGGGLESRVVRLPGLQLGEGRESLGLEDLVITLAREAQGRDASPPWDGLIGLGLLERFRVFYDMPASQLFLLPHAGTHRPWIYAPTGLGFELPQPDGLRVSSVAPDSAADAAGLMPGDLILEVADQTAAGWTRADWRRAMRSRTGQAVGLSVRRGDRSLDLQILVRPVL